MGNKDYMHFGSSKGNDDHGDVLRKSFEKHPSPKIIPEEKTARAEPFIHYKASDGLSSKPVKIPLEVTNSQPVAVLNSSSPSARLAWQRITSNTLPSLRSPDIYDQIASATSEMLETGEGNDGRDRLAAVHRTYAQLGTNIYAHEVNALASLDERQRGLLRLMARQDPLKWDAFAGAEQFRVLCEMARSSYIPRGFGVAGTNIPGGPGVVMTNELMSVKGKSSFSYEIDPAPRDSDPKDLYRGDKK